MGILYNRDIEILAGPLTISARTETGATQPMLGLKFDIVKSLARSDNTATLSVYNLAATNRTKLQEKGLEVIVKAGYVDEIVQIFKGEIDTSRIERRATEWVVELQLLDGGRRRRTSRTNRSFRGGQSIGQMLQQVASDIGLDVGNLVDKVRSDGARSVLKQLVSGSVFSGKTDDIIDELASSMGLKYSVQDGKLQFLGKNEALPGPAVPLALGTGLVGSPSIGEKGVVTARSLLNGRIVPGRKVALTSVLLAGEFIADKVRHQGETWGPAWITEMELHPT